MPEQLPKTGKANHQERQVGKDVEQVRDAGERAAELLGRFLLHAKPVIRLEAVKQIRPAAASMADDLTELAEKDPDPAVRSALEVLISEVGDKPDA